MLLFTTKSLWKVGIFSPYKILVKTTFFCTTSKINILLLYKVIMKTQYSFITQNFTSKVGILLQHQTSVFCWSTKSLSKIGIVSLPNVLTKTRYFLLGRIDDKLRNLDLCKISPVLWHSMFSLVLVIRWNNVCTLKDTLKFSHVTNSDVRFDR